MADSAAMFVGEVLTRARMVGLMQPPSPTISFGKANPVHIYVPSVLKPIPSLRQVHCAVFLRLSDAMLGTDREYGICLLRDTGH